MTQKRPHSASSPMARDVAPSSQTAPVDSPAPANGMNIRESKIEAAKEFDEHPDKNADGHEETSQASSSSLPIVQPSLMPQVFK